MAASFTFSLPRGFGPIPLDPVPEQRAARAERLLGHLPPEAAVDRAQAVEGLVIAGGALLAAGAVVAGELTVLDEGPGISATASIAVRDLPDGGPVLAERSDRRTSAEAIGDVLQAHHPDAEVQVKEFRGGPAVILAQAGEYHIPGDQMTTGEPVVASSVSMQIIFPAPDGATMVVVDVTTRHLDLWPSFAQLAFSMAEGIWFEADNERIVL